MNLSFRHYYWRWLKNLVFLFIIMVLLMTMARLTFAFYFGDWNELLQEPGALRSAFLLGLRYDLMPLAYINIVPFLILQFGYFLPGKAGIKSVRFGVVSFLFVGYILLGWLFLCDYAFYSYFQDHLNILFFGFFEDDTVAVLVSIWKNYHLPFWLVVIFLVHYCFFRLVKFLFSPFDFDLKVKKFDYRIISSCLGGLILLALFARGNFTRLPLSLEDAHISSNEFINELSLNGVLTLNRAIKIRKTYGQKEYDYLSKFGFKSWQEAYEAVFSKQPRRKSFFQSLKTRTSQNEILEKSPPHVVMLVMESFGTYWNDHNSPEFNILGELDRHFKQGVLFNNFLSAENGTIGSMVSVATSQVIRPGARFLSESGFMKTPLDIAGHLPYKAAGYETHFIYGGKLGWRDLGKYLSVQGYDHLWGADEIKEAMPELRNIAGKDLGNEWGIFDEYLYSFIDEQLRTSTRPQFFLVLTTSNHPPFEYPSSYNTLPLNLDEKLLSKITVDEDLARKRFLGLQYGNQKTGEFITKIKESALSDRVVVALTGDHSYWIAKGVGLDEEFKRYAVPFFISLPQDLKPKNYDPENFGSHEDIFPTLYHLTLSNAEYIKLGEDLISEEGIAMNSSGLVANKIGAYHHGSFWKWKDLKSQILEKTEETPELQKIKKHSAGMVGITDLYLKEEKARKQSVSKKDQ